MARDPAPASSEPAGRRSIPLRHDGRDRPYLLQAPAATGGTPGAEEAIPEAIPLLVELHGRGIDAGRLACERADLLAGVAQVAGTASAEVAVRACPAGPLPILQIHGTDDAFSPYEGGRRRGLRAGLILLGRSTGPSIGVDEWAHLWVAVDRADDRPEVEALPPDTTVRRWRGPSPASDVVFYRVEGAGHTWPGARLSLPRVLFGRAGRAFDATRVIWDFFGAHARGD